jgi:hypothetical protein
MPPIDPRGALRDRVPVVALLPPAPLAPGRALRESLSIAVLLLLWTVLSWLVFEPFVDSTVELTGVVVALGYVVVRGVRLRAEATPLVVTDAGSVLGQHARLALAPLAWFLAAALVPLVEDLWSLLGLFGLFTSPGGDLVRVCALTGLGTAALLVVAGVTAALDGQGGSASGAD